MTVEQHAVSDPTVSAWVAASAGTGKTHVLTNRVLRLLLNGAAPDTILCLTFTKAAAAEMAGRINSKLAKWAIMPGPALSDDLTALTGLPPTGDETKRARSLFAQVLDVPGGLKIQTIHAFCQSLMGRFPLETGIAPHTQVLDERSSAALQNEAIARVLATAQRPNAPDDLRTALNAVSSLTTDFNLPSLIAALLHDREALRASGGPDNIFATLGLKPGTTEEGLIADACAEGAFDRPGLEAGAAALRHSTKTDQNRAALLANWLARDRSDRIAGFKDYTGVYLTQAGSIRANLPNKGTRDHDEAAADCVIAEAERIYAVDQACKLCRVAHASAALWTLGQALLAEYATLKRQHAVLDYDDLILKARDLVTNGDNAAWVLYKLDAAIEHILVDEAQDTNGDQWAIIEALADEFFSGLGTKDTPRTVFAVGDAKQSIYSFQRAEPAEFERTRISFGHRVRAAEQVFKDGLLDLSFRSTETVLGLVDAVFENPVARAGLVFGAQERAIRHQAHRAGVAGLVELWPTEKPAPLEDPAPWTPPTQRLDALAPTVRLARRITKQIRCWLDSGAVLPSKNRPIEPGDILILVRRRDVNRGDPDAGFFNAIIRALKRANVPVAGVDRMILTEQLAVMDLLALADFALMPDDDLTLATVLKSPLVNWSRKEAEDLLFKLAHGRQGTLWRELAARRDENPAFTAAHDFLSACLARADYTPPFAFFSRVLDGGGRRALLARLGPDAADPLDEFLALALDYERTHAPSLQGFVHWVRAAQTEVKREMDQGRGEVRVMTVHGAKGLQAPIVFLPDTCSVPRTSPDFIWLTGDRGPVLAWPAGAGNRAGPVADAFEAIKAKQTEEYNRQLYVALTRAADQLYVCGYETSQKPAGHCWYNLIDAGFDALSAPETTGFDGAPVRQIVHGDKVEKPDAETADAPIISPLPDWATVPPAPEPVPARPLMPSRPTYRDMAVRSPLDGVETRRFHRGTLIHQLLQYLPDLPEATWADTARTWLAKPAHGLDADTANRWADEVLAILTDPAFAPLFGPDSAAEVPVAGLLGETPVSGQIDRVAVTDDTVLIVDYKTNRPPPARAEDVPALYLGQLAAYRDLMRMIYPGRTARCALLWTDGPALMALSDALLDPYSPLVKQANVTTP